MMKIRCGDVGGKTATGRPCIAYVMQGKTRCRWHWRPIPSFIKCTVCEQRYLTLEAVTICMESHAASSKPAYQQTQESFAAQQDCVTAFAEFSSEGELPLPTWREDTTLATRALRSDWPCVVPAQLPSKKERMAEKRPLNWEDRQRFDRLAQRIEARRPKVSWLHKAMVAAARENDWRQMLGHCRWCRRGIDWQGNSRLCKSCRRRRDADLRHQAHIESVNRKWREARQA